MDISQATDQVLDLLIGWAPRLALGIVAFIIGWWIIDLISVLAQLSLKRSKVDITLRRFVRSLLKITLRILLVITIVSMLGVEMTSFIALLGAAGLAVGLALQGSLANFAGGVLILFFRPFKVGDYIEAQGHAGTVDQIQIFNTVLKTPDNKTIIIPNGPLSNGSMTNYSTEDQRRVDFVFGIGYNDSSKKAIQLIEKIIAKDERILTSPEPFVRVSELADSSVNITVRVWAKKEDYWGIHFDMIEQVKASFDKSKISIPYPQMDVHLQK